MNLSKTTELEVSWEALSSENIGGNFEGYTLRYRIRTTSRFEEPPPFVVKTLGPSVHKYTLTNLVPNSVYEIGIAGRTGAGSSSFAESYGETCRCPKIVNTNYWFLSPYLNKTSDDKTSGIFAEIIPDMIEWACGDCKNGHGKTVVDLAKDAVGASADKKSMIDVIDNIYHDNVAQVSFPINGNKYMNRVFGDQPFVPVVESPGIVFLSLTRPTDSPAWSILTSLTNTLPYLLFIFTFVYFAGFIVWLLDAHIWKGSTFSRSFVKGVPQGMWWAVITMTTVGYGDKVPKHVGSRLFAMFWILLGIVMISILTGTITTSLTTLTMKDKGSIYGLTVAAIQNSSEHRIGVLRNGKVNQVREYYSVEDIRQAVITQEVQGALIDTYVVAKDIKRFHDVGIEATKLIDRSFGYGITLSDRLTTLEKRCREYLKLHEKEIMDLIDRSTGTLEKPATSPAVEISSGLFDPSSILYQNTLIFFGSCLGIAIVFGIIWDYTYVARLRKKITPARKKEIMTAELRKMVEEFYTEMKGKVEAMKKKHRKEISELLRREKEKQKQASQQEQEKAKDKKKESKDDDLNAVFIALKPLNS